MRNGRTEDAAGHGAGLVKLAVSGFRIERGTGFVVGEIGESLFSRVSFMQNTANGISWEIFR